MKDEMHRGWIVGTGLLAGGGVGYLLALTWIEVNLLLFPLTIALLVYVRTHKIPRIRRTGDGLIIGSLVSLVLCGWLGPNYYEAKVGPARYENITLGELCYRLRNDWGFHLSAYHESARQVPRFEIPQPMARRAILRKLAQATGLVLKEGGFCGNGSTILHGGSPMGDRLESAASVVSKK